MKPNEPTLQVGIPVEWLRNPWPKCIRYAPPELTFVGDKYSAKIDLHITDTSRPDPDQGFMPRARVESMEFAYGVLYEDFKCLEFTIIEVPGAEAAARMNFRYRSYGVECVDCHTMAQSGNHDFTVMCSAVAKFGSAYEAVYRAVLESVHVLSVAADAS